MALAGPSLERPRRCRMGVEPEALYQEIMSRPDTPVASR